MTNKQIAAALTALKDGDLSVRLPENDPKTREIASAYNALADQTALLHREVGRVLNEIGPKGRFGGQVSVPDANGAWKEMVESVNYTAALLTVQIRSLSMVAALKADGAPDVKVTAHAEGETKELIDALNSIGEPPMVAAF